MKPIILLFILTLFCFDNLIAQSIPSSDTIVPKISIPTIFTAEDEGFSDRFCVQKLDSSEILKFKLVIYNRWGELVFTSFDILKCWDGRTKNGKAPEGTYFYILDLEYYNALATEKVKKRSYNGAVALIRLK